MLRAIIGSKSAILLQQGPVDYKFQVERVTPTSHSFSHKTSLNDHSCGIKIWTDFSFVLSQSTHLTGRQTDGQIDRILITRLRLHSMQCGNTDMLSNIRTTYRSKSDSAVARCCKTCTMSDLNAGLILIEPMYAHNILSLGRQKRC